jgi:Predicted transcriptional regulator with C-terminal CBS domains
MTKSADDAPEAESSPAGFDPGRRLRQLRQEFGLSQRELARRAGMTNANLSMIEQGRVSPSIQTLEKILRAIPVSLADFFRSGELVSPVVFHRSNQIKVSQPGGEFFMSYRSGHGDRPILVQGYLAVGASISEIPVGHKNGWLSGSVTQGRVLLTLENDARTLEAGDMFQFHQNRSFCLENRGDGDLHLTLVVIPDKQDLDSKV